MEAARQPFAEENEPAFLCKSVNPRLKMQNVFSPELCGVGQGHPPPFQCWLLSCLTLALKAVVRDHFLTDPNREVSGCLQECAQEHLQRESCPVIPLKRWRKMYICLSFDFFSLLHAQAAQSSQISSPSEQSFLMDVPTAFSRQLLPRIPVYQ